MKDIRKLMHKIQFEELLVKASKSPTQQPSQRVVDLGELEKKAFECVRFGQVRGRPALD